MPSKNTLKTHTHKKKNKTTCICYIQLYLHCISPLPNLPRSFRQTPAESQLRPKRSTAQSCSSGTENSRKPTLQVTFMYLYGNLFGYRTNIRRPCLALAKAGRRPGPPQVWSLAVPTRALPLPRPAAPPPVMPQAFLAAPRLPHLEPLPVPQKPPCALAALSFYDLPKLLFGTFKCL